MGVSNSKAPNTWVRFTSNKMWSRKKVRSSHSEEAIHTYDSVPEIPIYAEVDKTKKKKHTSTSDADVHYSEVHVLKRRSHSTKRVKDWQKDNATEYAVLRIPSADPPQLGGRQALDNHSKQEDAAKPPVQPRHTSKKSPRREGPMGPPVCMPTANDKPQRSGERATPPTDPRPPSYRPQRRGDILMLPTEPKPTNDRSHRKLETLMPPVAPMLTNNKQQRRADRVMTSTHTETINDKSQRRGNTLEEQIPSHKIQRRMEALMPPTGHKLNCNRSQRQDESRITSVQPMPANDELNIRADMRFPSTEHRPVASRTHSRAERWTYDENMSPKHAVTGSRPVPSTRTIKSNPNTGTLV
ncbi:uncharacterized protein LOC120535813 isoform X1 [Polypterus senegalus]|uniref:uncharacterized protein LOC120535813 isoform X1 n=2 Tax=Polypterus senegalus TaxID=55291 RepID=UPI00196259BD|nr:uncharacterized protein LOC120535813 isoform X1 [Polypterus senegalus]